MVFNSLSFLIFLPIVIALHYLLPTRFRWVALLAASYYFYMYWDAKLIVLIMFTTAVSYVTALLVAKTDSKAKKRLYLALALIASLGVLVFFKYYNFMSGTVEDVIRLFGGEPHDLSLSLILPVGISFYTFQTLSYVIDVYRGNIKPERHFGYYALFVSFFPQLVAGPIERPENLLPQLRAPHKMTRENMTEGLGIVIVGFFKKLVVADIVAVYVNAVYNNLTEATGLGVLVATVLFAVQIYCDFSGYTDIAIGCARMMDIKLMQNFDRPYTARSIKEFWNRWHISLSTWFRDYLYIPLGGNRKGKVRRYINLMIVFLVSGLWHGAAWTFVLWGALHGVYQIIGGVTQKTRERIYTSMHINMKSGWFRALQRAFTFVLVCFAWIFFRANSISDIGIIMTKLFTDWGGLSYAQSTFTKMGLDLTMALAIAVAVWMLTRFDRRPLSLMCGVDDDGKALPSAYSYAYIVWLVIVAAIIIASGDGESTFIYFQF